MPKFLRNTIILVAVILVIGTGLFVSGANFYTDLLWFQNLGLASVFWTVLFSSWGIRIAVWLLFFLFLYLNLLFTRKSLLDTFTGKEEPAAEDYWAEESEGWRGLLKKGHINILLLVGSLLISFLFSSGGAASWSTVLKFFNNTPFNITDPLFGRDLGFYIFQLPFFELVYDYSILLVVLTAFAVGAIYILTGTNRFQRFYLSTRAKVHLSLLVAIFLAVKGLGYRLNMYQLLYSPRGVVFGASYTDVHARLLSYQVLTVVVLAAAILVLLNMFFKTTRWLVGALGLWLIASIILGGVYPAVIQKFQVEPNEIAKEAPYIEHNIKFTQQAFDLAGVKTRPFSNTGEITYQTLQENQATISNIRLWDWRPLKTTYNQIQALRPYYYFNGIDVDRYEIDGQLREVMISARELRQDLLDERARTWVNLTLKYTHGFGVALSPVNKVTTQGLPDFYIENIPPQTEMGFQLENPRIYYGELTNNEVIVNTESQEFDYPMGSQNAYFSYDGNGGIELNSLFRKLAFATRFGSLKLLLANDITNESRVMLYRNFRQRVKKVAPFLKYDNDPYLVIVDGKLYWIQDAYTISNRYPYSQPYQGWGNYVRNSVKVVIDAYHGDMKFYTFTDDPIAQTYMKIFPDLFTPESKAPEGLRKHWRYPEDLFSLQARVFSTYHMEDPVVFYNKEDLWNIPTEKYSGDVIEMRPYYIILELPGEEDQDFVLIQPFTPARKNNMVAWMAVKNDPGEYGEKVIYTFPKQRLAYGPIQIEARIDQDSSISQQLSLWDQKGSNVIRGNLLVIPINNSIMYVEPLYLQAQQSQLPQLKRVLVAYEDEIVMDVSLEAALNRVFGTEVPEEVIPTAPEEEQVQGEEQQIPLPESLQKLAARAMEVYKEAQQKLQDGDWAGYGEAIGQLEEILNKMEEYTE
ncbi:MAG: UPF0182 family protein [Halanaerobium sp.]|nr:UPF0182 family protein [Halanaerobium sp.]